MGRHKKETFYQLLQRKIREHGETVVEAMVQAANVNKPKDNSENCKRYRERHPDRAKNAAKNWFEKFKQEHGMSYATWYYRKKHSLL